MYNALEFSIKCLNIGGISFPRTPNLGKPWISLWWLYSIFGSISFLWIFVTTNIATAASTNNLADFSLCFFSALILWQNIVKQTCIWLYRKDLLEVLGILTEVASEINKSVILKPPSSKTKMNRLLHTVTAIRFTFEVIIVLIIGSTLATRCLLGMPSELIANAWFPYDAEEGIICALTNIAQVIAIMYNSARAYARELFIQTLIMLVGIYLEYLKQNLNVIVKQFDCQRKSVTVNQLNWWIQQHQRLLRAMELIKRFISPMLLGYYLLNLSEVLLALFTFTYDIEVDDIHQRGIVFKSLVGMAQFYMFSIFAEHTNKMEHEVAFDALFLAHKIMDVKIRKTYIMILMRSNRETELAAYGLYKLSSATFGVLAKATFSFYVTILQIKEAKEAR